MWLHTPCLLPEFAVRDTVANIVRPPASRPDLRICDLLFRNSIISSRVRMNWNRKQRVILLVVVSACSRLRRGTERPKR